jgi:hypothetical protein
LATNKNKQQKYWRLQRIIKILDTSKRNESFALRLSMPTEDYRPIEKKRKGDGMK